MEPVFVSIRKREEQFLYQISELGNPQIQRTLLVQGFLECSDPSMLFIQPLSMSLRSGLQRGQKI